MAGYSENEDFLKAAMHLVDVCIDEVMSLRAGSR